jgi:hypothetical protein
MDRDGLVEGFNGRGCFLYTYTHFATVWVSRTYSPFISRSLSLSLSLSLVDPKTKPAFERHRSELSSFSLFLFYLSLLSLFLSLSFSLSFVGTPLYSLPLSCLSLGCLLLHTSRTHTHTQILLSLEHATPMGGYLGVRSETAVEGFGVHGGRRCTCRARARHRPREGLPTIFLEFRPNQPNLLIHVAQLGGTGAFNWQVR